MITAWLNYWTPYKGTLRIDHWGYSNGADNRGYLSYFPTSSLDNNKETITSTQRNPNFKYALCGALQEIYYPTGGKTEFIYEPNDYSAALISPDCNMGNLISKITRVIRLRGEYGSNRSLIAIMIRKRDAGRIRCVSEHINIKVRTVKVPESCCVLRDIGQHKSRRPQSRIPIPFNETLWELPICSNV